MESASRSRISRTGTYAGRKSTTYVVMRAASTTLRYLAIVIVGAIMVIAGAWLVAQVDDTDTPNSETEIAAAVSDVSTPTSSSRNPVEIESLDEPDQPFTAGIPSYWERVHHHRPRAQCL